MSPAFREMSKRAKRQTPESRRCSAVSSSRSSQIGARQMRQQMVNAAAYRGGERAMGAGQQIDAAGFAFPARQHAQQSLLGDFGDTQRLGQHADADARKHGAVSRREFA